MTDEDLALAELKMLQDVIARQDGFKDKTKAVAVTLFSALSVGYFSGQITLSWWQYFLTSAWICVAFVALEGLYGATEIKAESRVKKVEAFLRKERDTTYGGPAMLTTLVQPGSFGNMLESILRWRTRFLYLSLLLFSALAALYVQPSHHPDQNIETQLSQLLAASARQDQKATDFDKRLNDISELLKSDKTAVPVRKKK